MIKQLSLIACVSQDGGLGYHGELLWHIPEDMQFFKQTTLGSPVIMGRKTFESIGRALPGRENIVLSRHEAKAPEVKWFSDIAKLKEYLAAKEGPKFIIGGASLYEMFIDEAGTLYLTEVAAQKPADTYFPQFNPKKFERQILKTGESQNIEYTIVKYDRKDENGTRA